MTSSQTAWDVLLEVCVGSTDDAVAATRAGANRLELCGALELGGLTPSLGLIESVVSEVDLPVMVMLRPRAGGFAYSDHELGAMVRDAELALAAGARGIVFGVLNQRREINRNQTQQLVAAAQGRDTVFHRAFDSTIDHHAALRALTDLGVTRVLTSGGAGSAEEGTAAIRELVCRGGNAIEILPCGRIMPHNVCKLVEETGCSQVHIGAATSYIDASIERSDAAALGDLPRLQAGEIRVVSETIVESVALALKDRPAPGRRS